MFNPIRMRAIYAIWRREVLLYLLDRVRVFTSISTPILVFLIFGTGLKFIIPANLLGYDFAHFFYPGIIAAMVAIMAFDSGMSIVWDREFGFLREILVSPISRTDLALGKLLGATTRCLIQALPMLLIAPFIGLTLSLAKVLVIILTIIVLGWGLAGLGVLISSRMRRVESFNIVIQILIAPMIFLSGAFFPTHDANNWIKTISNFDPLTYGVDGLRYIFLNSSVNAKVLDILTTHNFLTSASFLLIFAILMTFVSILVFRKMK
ncbi:MAG: ABC transporter permease [Candidatus Parcubacteria bacterium]|nr:ABC transporter permease [Candidatus Parcubacteria bacterium]